MKRVISIALVVSCAAAQAIMIDDFETGPFDAVLSNNYVSQTGLPMGNAIGGTRAAHGFNTGGFLQMTCTAGGTGNLVLNTISSSFSDVFWLGPLSGGVPPSGAGTLLPEDFDGIAPAINLTGSSFFKIAYTATSSDYQVNIHVYNSDLSESVSSQFIPVALRQRRDVRRLQRVQRWRRLLVSRRLSPWHRSARRRLPNPALVRGRGSA